MKRSLLYKAFLVQLIVLGSIFAPLSHSVPYPYPYPYPYEGASVTGPWKYSATGGTSASFQVPAGDIKNGELVSYGAIASSSWKVSYDVRTNSDIQAGERAGHIDETYTISAFGQESSSNYFIDWRCSFSPCAPGAAANNQPLLGNASAGVVGSVLPRFESFRSTGVPNWAEDYENTVTPLLGGTTATFSVKSTKVNDKGVVNSFSNDSTYQGEGGYLFRPWTTTDVLSGTIQPVVQNNFQGGLGARIFADPKPLFGFTVEEAAHLSGYDHFNWLQQVYEVRTGVNNFPFPPVIYNQNTGNLNALIQNYSRGLGPDPRMGCIYDPNVQPNLCSDDLYKTDNIPLYLDEEVNGYVAPRNLVKNAPDYRWNGPNNNNKWNNGLFFEDAPNLKVAGTQVFFVTELVGVKYGANGAYESYDVFSRLNIPNPEDFVFRWKFTQTGNSTRNIGMLQNVDELLAGIGEIEFLGMGFGDLEPPPITGIPDGGNGGNGGSGPPITTPIPGTAWLAGLGLAVMSLTRKRRVIRLR